MVLFRNNPSKKSYVTVYAIIAVVAIIAFQLYWLYTVSEARKQIVMKTSYHLLESSVNNIDAYVFYKSLSLQEKRNQNVNQLDKKIVDSLFVTPDTQEQNNALLANIEASLSEIYPSLKFGIFNTARGETQIVPNNSVRGDHFTKTITTQLNPAYSFQIHFSNLNAFVLAEMRSSIVISLLFLFICISATILIISNTKKARRLMEMKDNFTNNMTHELKTPLATLLVATEALDKYNVLEDKPVAREYIQIMQADLKRLAGMAESILYNAKLSAGKIHLKTVRLNVKRLFEDVLAKFKPMLEQQDVKVTVTIPDDLYIMADAEHIINVFSNLIDNALKYSKDKIAITITAAAEGDMARITITDNGIGISAEHHKDIFKPYFRVSEGDRHKVKGYGLGLSYSREIVVLHGGTISVLKSDSGKGTAFEIKLPAAWI